MTLLRFGLRLSSRPYFTPTGGMLIIAPHADDETLGCGGLIATQTQAAQSVEIVFLTDSAGSPPSPGLAEKRRLEAQTALAVLGLKGERIHFLDLPDGTLDRLAPETVHATVEHLAQLIDRLRPAEVLVPYRHGGSTEHTAAWHLGAAALGAAGGGTMLEYPIWAWWNPLRLCRRLGRRQTNLSLDLGSRRLLKRRALACHESQVVPVPPCPDPALPDSLAWACCGATEFFFASRIPARHPSLPRNPER